MERNVKIVIGVIACLIGICFICSNYYLSLKHEVFDDMNKLYYEQKVAINEELSEIVAEGNDNDSSENEVVTEPVHNEEENNNNEPPIENTEPTTVPPAEVESYIGYLSIPKIDLNRGFYSINSKQNNVNKNIYVHPASTFPSDSNNLILASHSGTSSISYFKNLYKLVLDDDIYLEYNSIKYHYKIKDIYKVTKNGSVGLRINKNISTLTLITCTKNDKNSQTVYIAEIVK